MTLSFELMAPADVRGAHRRPAHRLSGCVFALGGRAGLRLPRDPAGLFRFRPVAGAAGAHLRHRLEPAAAGDPVLHLHGRDPRAMRARRRAARYDGAAVRTVARRTGLFGDPGRRAARRDHRHGRGLRHRDGLDLAAGDDALRLRPQGRRPASSPPPAPSPRSFRRRWCWSCSPTPWASRSATCMPAPSSRASSSSGCSAPRFSSSASSGRKRFRPCRRRCAPRASACCSCAAWSRWCRRWC